MPLHITMRQLQVFEAVARHLSYTRAAEELHLTQPAVSMQVKQLERMVELPLVELVGRRAHLTAAGRAMLAHSREMLAQLRDIETDVERMRGVDGGALNICIAPTVNYFATGLIAAFRAAHPAVDIRITVTDRVELARRLAANEPDLALMERPAAGLRVAAFAFMENPLIVIAHPRHRLAAKKKIPLEDIEGEAFVLRAAGDGERRALTALLAKHGVAPGALAESPTDETVKQRVAAGLGLGLVSKHTVELELAAGRLTALDLRHFPIMRKWFIAHRKGKRLSQTGQAFFDFALQEGRRERGRYPGAAD